MLVRVDQSQLEYSPIQAGTQRHVIGVTAQTPYQRPLGRGPVGSSVCAAGFQPRQKFELERSADSVGCALIAGYEIAPVARNRQSLEQCFDSAPRGRHGRYL
jgi:hypothetical protein